LGGGVLAISFAAILCLGDQGLRGKIETATIFTAAASIGDVPLSAVCV